MRSNTPFRRTPNYIAAWRDGMAELDEILEIQSYAIARSGVSTGIRDRGGLESA